MTAPTWLQALILGLVQGLTEFIPVSSSAHLVLVPAYLGWQRPGLAFDVALHVGTLVALHWSEANPVLSVPIVLVWIAAAGGIGWLLSRQRSLRAAEGTCSR